MYNIIRHTCAIQSYVLVCMSFMLAQLLRNLVAKRCLRGQLRPWTTACMDCVARIFSMEEHNRKRFSQVPVPLTAHGVRFQ